MPVSKKRKKDPKKAKVAKPQGLGHPPAEPPHPERQQARPQNQFGSHQPLRPLGSQRGR
jgi:hypothetical protein